MMNNEVKIFSVYEGFMNELEKKLRKIEKKCEKYGKDFNFEIVGEEFRNVETPDGETMKCKFNVVKVDGTAVINDWEVVASVEHTENGNIYSKALDVEIPVKYRNTKCTCEHCNTNRKRKNTFIIRNIKTDEFKQIGNTCLRDYTQGLSAEYATMMISLKDIFTEYETRPITGCGYIQKYYDTYEVLKYGAETVRHFGYVKSGHENSTKDRMLRYFNYHHGNTFYWTSDMIEEVKNEMSAVNFNPESEEAEKMVNDVMEWLKSQDESNDYMHNLKTVVSLHEVNIMKFGLLISVFPTWDRHCKRDREITNMKSSKYVGNIGDRIDINIKSVKVLTCWETQFGTTFIYQITDTDENIYIWKTSKYISDESKTLKGTVKEHKEFRGINQTELTRCKVN